jgi:uncharacterized alpha-E superfamily protein
VLNTQHSDAQASVPLMDWLQATCLKLEVVHADALHAPYASSPDAPNSPDVSGTSVAPATSPAWPHPTPGQLADALLASLPAGSPLASVGNTLVALRNAASQLRHHMGRDHWHAISAAERDFAQAGATGSDMTWALQQLRERLVGIVGAQLDHMTRDDGWRILTLGRHTERLGFFSQALAQAFYANAVHDVDGHEAVLTLFDSTISFHARYQQSLNTASLLDLLVISDENPRSLGFVTTGMHKVLGQLRQHAPENAADLAQGIPLASHASLAQLCAADERGNYPHLQALLQQCDEAAQRLTEQVSQRHFTHYHEARRAVWA